MKKIIFSFLGIFLFLGSFLFVACGEQIKGEIEVSSNYFMSSEDYENYIELSLNESDIHTASIDVRVNKANDGRVKISNNYESVVSTSTTFDPDENLSVITLTAQGEGRAQLILNSYSGSADPVTINVFVYSDLVSLSQKENPVNEKKTQFVEIEKTLDLVSDRFLIMESRKNGESNRKEITWSFNTTDTDYYETNNVAENKIDLFNVNGAVVATISENKTLIVHENYQGEEISLKATSRTLSTEVNLEILNTTNDKFSELKYGRISSSVSEKIDGNISIVRNNDSVMNKEAYLRFKVDCAYDFEVTPVVYLNGEENNNVLAVTLEQIDNDGYYIYKVRGKKDVDSTGAEIKLKFIASYTEFDKTIESGEVSFVVSDVVDAMLVTADEGLVADNATYELYQAYANGKGKYFNIQLKPDTVDPRESKFYIEIKTSDSVANIKDVIQVTHEKTPLELQKDGDVWKSSPINTNSEIYVMSKKNATGTITMMLVAEKANNIKKEIEFKCVEAPSSITVGEDITKYLATNSYNEVWYEVPVTGVTSGQGLYLEYDKSAPIETSDISYESENGKGVIKFKVTNTKIDHVQENIAITICHKNGMKADKNVILNTFIPLSQVSITIDPTTLTGVPSYTYQNNSLSDLVAALGSSVKLNYNVIGEYTDLKVYEVVDNKNVELGADWYGKEARVLFAKETTHTYQSGTGTSIEKKSLKFVFEGYNEDYEEITQSCEFDYEVYVPVSTLKSVESTTIALTAEDSLSIEDSSKSVKHVVINLRSDTNKITYADKELFSFSIGDTTINADEDSPLSFLGTNYSYTIDNISVENNQLSFDVHAKSTNGYGISRNTLNIEYNKYNTLRLSLTLNVQNAVRASEVIWENEVDSIYLDLSSTDVNDRNFVMITTVNPSDAYNKQIEYKFIPDNGTGANVISINNNIVSVGSNQILGGTGYIYMFPKDSVKKVNGIDNIVYLKYNSEKKEYEVNYVPLNNIGNEYSTLLSNDSVFLSGLDESGNKTYVAFNKVIKKIRVIVADGRSQSTAYRIYSEQQLKTMNVAQHYILMNDLALEGWTSLNPLKGSLSGYVKESEKEKGNYVSNVTIEIKSGNSLFKKIESDAKVDNLTIKGNVTGAFVASINEGTISNIIIDVVIDKNGKVAGSAVSSNNDAGAIAVENSGTISNIKVYGATISGRDFVGGITGKNSGTISNAYVELYKFSGNSNSKIISENNYAGGLVGQSLSGTIKSSYIYDYDLQTGGSSKITGKEGVGAMIGCEGEVSTQSGSATVGTQSSTIENSFAVVNIAEYAKNFDKSKAVDSYLSYYEGGEYKSDIPENKDDNKWLSVGKLGFEPYVNKGEAHLKFYQANIVDVNNLVVSSIDGKVLKVNDTTGILMRTSVTSATTALSNGEKNKLEDLNKISFKELFPYISDSSDIVVVSSDSNIVETTSNSIYVKETSSEIITLTVYSKKDYSKSKQFNFVVINTISNFKTDISGNSMKLQVGNTASINYSIKNVIYLGTSKVYNLVQDNYLLEATHTALGINANVEYITFNISGFAGTVAATNTENTGSYTLTATLSVRGLTDDYQDAIKTAFTKDVTLETFKGSRRIGVSNSQIVVYPSTTSTVKIDLDTDDKDTDDIEFKIVKDLKDLDFSELSYTKTDGKEEYIYTDSVEKICILKTKNSQNYVLTLSIVNDYRNVISEEETFYLIINSKTKTADNEGYVVSIKLEPQDINHIDMTSYLSENVVWDSTDKVTLYNRKNQISSMLSPGNFSYMVIGIDPTYSYYEYFTIGTESSEGYYLNLTKMNQYSKSLSSYVIDNSNEFSYLGNSLKVQPAKTNRPEQYIFRVYASKSITKDCIIPLKITFYGKDGEQLDTASYAYNITYQKPAQIEVNPNKSNSSILAKGGSVDVKISIGKDQTLNREDIGLSGVKNGITIGEILGPFENSDGTKYFTTKVRANVDAKINGTENKLGGFQIYARVSRFVNGVKEIEETRSTLTLVDFSISSSTKQINIYKDAIQDFDLSYTFDPVDYSEGSNIVDGLIEKRATFSEEGYYHNVNESFSINTEKNEEGEIVPIPVTDRMYMVSGNNSTKIRFDANGEADCGQIKLTYDSETKKMSVTGVATTDEPIRIKLVNKIYTNKYSLSYNEVECYYDVSVTVYTDEEDNLLAISSASDFLDIAKNSTAENYILTSDIELVNYTPIDTSKIESLDGNGYTINITSFNMEGSGTLQRALFSTVAKNTTLKNVRVNYYYGGQIDVNVSSKDGYNNIQIAGFAINNQGIIYNCEVICMPYFASELVSTNINKLGLNVKLVRLNAEYIIQNGSEINSEIAGFVINNDGSITNSKVGGDSVLVLNSSGTSVSEQELETFNILGQGKISGFVSQNTGVIASSSANRVQITNSSQNINLFTSGFAYSNSGRISTSFVQGEESKTGDERTDKTLFLNGSSISSNGYVAGFISSNTGSIDNSYANIKIKGLDQDATLSYYSAGFVYENKGRIELCYASCKLESSNISQSNFSGVGIKGESLNSGTIEKCYYNAKDSNLAEDVENALETGATLARNPASETQFYGFSFASEINSNDGIWYIGADKLLTLTEANQRTYSHRQKISTTINGQSKYPYVELNGDSRYLYGNEYNPIIIRNAEEFDLAMGNPNAGTNMKNQISGDNIKGSYRIVSTIDLSELIINEEEINLSSTSKTFCGVLAGNGFSIENIAISSKNNDNGYNSVGLFSKLNGASIYNLKLEIANVTATNSSIVGGLAGTMVDGRLINIEVTQLMPTNTMGSNSYGVQGNNLVGGVIGAIFGDAKVTNISITNPIVQSAYYDETHSIGEGGFYDKNDNDSFSYKNVRRKRYSSISEFQEAVGELSFAGGLFGYVDIYKQSLRDTFNLDSVADNGYVLTNLKGYNVANIRGEVIGGLIGFVGISSNIKDAGFVFTSAETTTNIISYNGAAGGLFGYTTSIIKQVYAEYDTETQNAIEDNLSNYYTKGSSVERGYSEIFIDTSTWNISTGDFIKNKPEFLGGLIGYQKYGKLIASYSKINVIAGTDECIAGGVIGRVGNPSPQSAWSETVLNNGDPGTSTTSLLSEVYSSGDVRGKTGTTYTAGGIIGSIAKNAKVSMTAVNSVNYFGIDSFNTIEYTTTDGASLSNLGIYAFVGKNEGTLQSVLPVNLALKESTNAEGASLKHIAYVSKIIYKNTEIDIEPYEGYKPNFKPEDPATMANPKFDKYLVEIPSLSKITSRKTGYIEMNGYFLNSGNWSTDYWRQDLSDLYPTIKFVEVLDVLYLDQYNIDEVLILMQNSAKEVRVRGLKSKGSIEQGPIDLTGYKDLLNIENFAGRLIGGWDQNGEKDVNKVSSTPIILDPTQGLLFKRLGSGAVIKDLYIHFTTNDGSINFSGASDPSSTFIAEEIESCKFDNITFDYDNSNTIGNDQKGLKTINGIKLHYNNAGYAGLIVPLAKSTSFTDIKIIIGSASENFLSVEDGVAIDSKITQRYVGLLAGAIHQGSKYRTMEISNINICSQRGEQNLISATASADSTTYAGLYTGEIGDTTETEDSDQSKASIFLSIGHLSTIPNTSNNPTKPFSIGQVSVIDNAKNASTKGLYLGTFVGKASVQKVTLLENEEVDSKNQTLEKYDVSVKLSTPGEVQEAMYVGGMIGQLTTGSIVSEEKRDDPFTVTIAAGNNSSNTVGNINLGGLFGSLESNSTRITMGKISSTITNNNSNGNFTSTSLYVGGLIGHAKASNEFELTIKNAGSSTTTPTALTTTIREGNYLNEGTETFISGGIGCLEGTAKIIIDLGNGEFNSSIGDAKVKNSVYKVKNSVYAGGMFGEANAKSLEIKNSAIDYKQNFTDDSSITNLHSGAIGGYIDLTENLILDTFVPTASTPPTASVESTIKVPAVTTENYTAGLVGELSCNQVSFGDNVREIKSAITITGNANSLYTGIVFGELDANETSGIGDKNLTLTGSIISDLSKSSSGSGSTTSEPSGSGSASSEPSTSNNEPKFSELYLGAFAGTASNVTTRPNLTIQDFKVGSSADPINPTKDSIANAYKTNPIKAGIAYVGSLIGKGSNSITVNGGTIADSVEIALETSNNAYFGGLVGTVEGSSLTISSENVLKNSGLFALTSTVASVENKPVNNYVGGLVGYFMAKSTETEKKITIGSESSNTISAFVDANFFINANQLYAGGIVGYSEVYNVTSQIKDAIFGGAFKIYGKYSNVGTHYFGGIASYINGIKIDNCVSYGDYIVTYKDSEDSNENFSSLSRFIFGGIAGQDGGTISNSYSLTTCNNDRIATETEGDRRKAILGYGSGSDMSNLYSHSVTLTIDDNATDTGYKSTYEKVKIGSDEVYRGYGTCNTDNNLISLITGKLPDDIKDFGSGHKLNPITSIGSDASAHTNGVIYNVLDGDKNSATTLNPKNTIGSNTYKVAIVGDTREVTSSSETQKAYIQRELSQNEFISSIRLTVNIDADSGVKAGLIDSMTGGQIYAVAVYGEISIGGSNDISIAPIVGEMSGGLIDESVAGANITYRAGAGENAKVSGFANLSGSTPIVIRNSYSTGRVTTYSGSNAYGFTNGVSNATIDNCYTISQLDWHDYINDSSTANTYNFGEGATYTNCWYDQNATECSQTTKEGKIENKLTDSVARKYGNDTTVTPTGTNWTIDKDYNFGYQTRKFGFLKQSSYATQKTEGKDRYGKDAYTYTQKNWNNSTLGNDYIIVPNAGKFAQILSKLDGKYVMTNDFELKKAGITNTDFKFGTFDGILDGQEHTIDYSSDNTGNSPLFTSLSQKKEIKNLRLTNVNLNISTGNVGALVGRSLGTIYNVVASGFASVSNSSSGTNATVLNLGGIVGESSGTISYCKNYVKLDFKSSSPAANENSSKSGYADVGGIVGAVSGGTIDHCFNYAPIQNNAEYSGSTGGIVGYVGSSAKITNSGNTNSVIAGYTLSVTRASGHYQAGGIVGYVDKKDVWNEENDVTLTINNCYNTAMVKAGNKSSTSASYAGGIIGHLDGSITSGRDDNNALKSYNLYNAGVIEALGKNLEEVSIVMDGANLNWSRRGYFYIKEEEVNVYAESIIGSGGYKTSCYNKNNQVEISDYKNEGQVIRNGVYYIGGKAKIDNVQYQTIGNDFPTWGKTKTPFDSSTWDYKISFSNVQMHITGYDDLGYPSSYCFTAKRNVEIKYNGNDTGYYIVKNQTIISKTSYTDYYAGSKKVDEGSGEISLTNLLKQNQDKTSTMKSTTIAGDNVAIVRDGQGFETAVNPQYKQVDFTCKAADFSNYGKLGYRIELDGDVKAYKKDSSTQYDDTVVSNISAKIILQDSLGNYTLRIGYICTSKEEEYIDFKYNIKYTKETDTESIYVQATNVNIDGNDIKLYLGDNGSAQTKCEVKFTSKEDETQWILLSSERKETDSNNELNLKDAVIKLKAFFKISDDNFTIKYLKENFDITYKWTIEDKSVSSEGEYIEEILSATNTTVDTETISYQSTGLVSKTYNNQLSEAGVTYDKSWAEKCFKDNIKESTFKIGNKTYTVKSEEDITGTISVIEQNKGSYKQWVCSASCKGVLTKIESSYTFEKSSDSKVVYTILDNYENSTTVEDNSANTSTTIGYSFDYSDKDLDKDVIITYGKIEGDLEDETIYSAVFVPKTTTNSVTSSTYTNGGNYGTLAHLGNNYIKYSFGNDSMSDSWINGYIYETGTYGSTKITRINIVCDSESFKEAGTEFSEDFSSGTFKFSYQGVDEEGNAVTKYASVSYSLNSTTKYSDGNYVFEKDDECNGQVAFKITNSLGFSTGDFKVYVMFDRTVEEGEPAYGSEEVAKAELADTFTVNGATYSKLDNTINLTKNVTSSETIAKKYYTNTYQSWNYTINYSGNLKEINKSYTFSKEKDSIAVYEISDNYGHTQKYVDTSLGTSKNLSYKFSYDDELNDNVVITFKKTEYKLNKTNYSTSYDGVKTAYNYQIAVDEVSLGETTEVAFNINDNVLALKSGLTLTSSDESVATGDDAGKITVSGAEYDYYYSEDYIILMQGEKYVAYSEYEDVLTLTSGDQTITSEDGKIKIGDVEYTFSIDDNILTLTSGDQTITSENGKIKIGDFEYTFSSRQEHCLTIGESRYVVSGVTSNNGSKGEITIGGKNYKYLSDGEKYYLINVSNGTIIEPTDKSISITEGDETYTETISCFEINGKRYGFDLSTDSITSVTTTLEGTIGTDNAVSVKIGFKTYKFTYTNGILSSTDDGVSISGRIIGIEKNNTTTKYFYQVKDNKLQLFKYEDNKLNIGVVLGKPNNYSIEVLLTGLVQSTELKFEIEYEEKEYTILDDFNNYIQPPVTIESDAYENGKIEISNDYCKTYIFESTYKEDKTYTITVNYEDSTTRAAEKKSDTFKPSSVEYKKIILAGDINSNIAQGNISQTVYGNNYFLNYIHSDTYDTSSNLSKDRIITVKEKKYVYTYLSYYKKLILNQLEETSIDGTNGKITVNTDEYVYFIDRSKRLTLASSSTDSFGATDDRIIDIRGEKYVYFYSSSDKRLSLIPTTETNYSGQDGTIKIDGTDYIYSFENGKLKLSSIKHFLNLGEKGNLLAINIAGSVISDIGVEVVASLNASSNINLYGSLTSTKKDISNASDSFVSGSATVTSYMNYSAFSDQYTGDSANAGVLANIKTNYGLIVGFDGENGVNGTDSTSAEETGGEGADGAAGQSFKFEEGFTNNGIIKAGNGGNGGRGGDGYIGRDSTTGSDPTKGTSGGAGGTAGEEGTIIGINNGSAGSKGKKGFFGNTGHTGIRLVWGNETFTGSENKVDYTLKYSQAVGYVQYTIQFDNDRSTEKGWYLVGENRITWGDHWGWHIYGERTSLKYEKNSIKCYRCNKSYSVDSEYTAPDDGDNPINTLGVYMWLTIWGIERSGGITRGNVTINYFTTLGDVGSSDTRFAEVNAQVGGGVV